jgi:hypothetical protein
MTTFDNRIPEGDSFDLVPSNLNNLYMLVHENSDLYEIRGVEVDKRVIKPSDKLFGVYRISTPTERGDSNYGIHADIHRGYDGTTECVLQSVKIFAQGTGNILYLEKSSVIILKKIIEDLYNE